MKKVKTAYGYDIYELTKEECKKRWYEYPCFCAFCEGENFDTVGYEECSLGTLGELVEWCKEYARF